MKKELGIKSKVLKEIMDMMDMTEGENLKKHPKLIAAKVTVAKPVNEEEKEKIMEDMDEKKESMEEESDELDLENIDPELLKKLMKLAK